MVRRRKNKSYKGLIILFVLLVALGITLYINSILKTGDLEKRGQAYYQKNEHLMVLEIRHEELNKNGQVGLLALTEETKNRVQVQFRIREKGICSTGVIDSPWVNYNSNKKGFFWSASLVPGKTYEYSARAKDHLGNLSGGNFFCGTSGWINQEQFSIN